MSTLVFDDSGIDSGDKATGSFFNSARLEGGSEQSSPLDELEVVFRRSSVEAPVGATAPPVAHQQQQQQLAESADGSAVRRPPQPPNTCRILQRKLELKVERAKRNYSQHQQNRHEALDERPPRQTSLASNLLPISRLSIPGMGGAAGGGRSALLDPKPLVDYKSDSSDGAEEISFFPAKLKNGRRQRHAELSDTFSIQEMTIESDLDSDDSGGSQSLELLPPMMKGGLIEKLVNCCSCSRRSTAGS